MKTYKSVKLSSLPVVMDTKVYAALRTCFGLIFAVFVSFWMGQSAWAQTGQPESLTEQDLKFQSLKSYPKWSHFPKEPVATLSLEKVREASLMLKQNAKRDEAFIQAIVWDKGTPESLSAEINSTHSRNIIPPADPIMSDAEIIAYAELLKSRSVIPAPYDDTPIPLKPEPSVQTKAMK